MQCVPMPPSYPWYPPDVKGSNCGTLISNQSGPTLDFAQDGSNLQSKMADIVNVNFSYIFK